MAQLAEQLICNQQVIGSSPIIGFFLAYQQEKNKPQNIFSTLMAGAYDYLEIAKSSEEYRKKIEDVARWNWYLGKYGLKEK